MEIDDVEELREIPSEMAALYPGVSRRTSLFHRDLLRLGYTYLPHHSKGQALIVSEHVTHQLTSLVNTVGDQAELLYCRNNPKIFL